MGLHAIIKKVLNPRRTSWRGWAERGCLSEPSEETYIPTQRVLLVSLAIVVVSSLLLVTFLAWYLAFVAVVSSPAVPLAQHTSGADIPPAMAGVLRSGRFIHGGEEPARVKVLTSCHPSTGHKVWSIKNKKLYAQLQRYDFEWWIREGAINVTGGGAGAGDHDAGHSHPPIWNKSAMLLSELGHQRDVSKPWACNYDWLMWMDCDTLVSRFDMTVERIAGRHYHNHHKQLFLTRDKNGLNSGVMLMRCSEWNLRLWQRIWRSSHLHRDHPWAEQKALHALLEAEPQLKEMLVERPQAVVQHVVSQVQAWHKPRSNQGGETAERAALYRNFVLHFAGATPQEKDRVIAQHYQAIMLHAPWMDPAFDERIRV